MGGAPWYSSTRVPPQYILISPSLDLRLTMLRVVARRPGTRGSGTRVAVVATIVEFPSRAPRLLSRGVPIGSNFSAVLYSAYGKKKNKVSKGGGNAEMNFRTRANTLSLPQRAYNNVQTTCLSGCMVVFHCKQERGKAMPRKYMAWISTHCAAIENLCLRKLGAADRIWMEGPLGSIYCPRVQ
jgi:hypothetical protein